MTGEIEKAVVWSLVVAAALLMVVMASYSGYSMKGYSLTRYPGENGTVTLCIEGEVTPTNQTISVATSEPGNVWIKANNKQVVNETVEENKTYHLDNLFLGCNLLEYGSYDVNESFDFRISYVSHYRPEIVYLESANMKAESIVRYRISVKDSLNNPVEKTWLNITDISGKREVPFAYLVYSGPAKDHMMPNPSDYRAVMQVSDGVAMSDIYEAKYTTHVIQMDLQTNAVRIAELKDDEPVEYDGLYPPAIIADEHVSIKGFKRSLNGLYITSKKATYYMVYLARKISFGIESFFYKITS
ncbi:MAG: hypothetical protein KKD39_08840 [Candidatus Altiarchaeota archaeon]|nr:hypothetical protein [Candidatus Altiarchaeota archaeon]